MPGSITASIQPIISPPGKQALSRVTSGPQVKTWPLPGSNKLGKDVEALSKNVNTLFSALNNTSPTLGAVSGISNVPIDLSNGSNSITINPTTLQITLTDLTSNSSIVLDATVPSITVTNGAAPNQTIITIANGSITIAGAGTDAGMGTITIDGPLTSGSLTTGALTAASLTTAGALMAASAVLSGVLQAASAMITGALQTASAVITGNCNAGSYSAGGVPGISVVRTFRNAAGTGTSTDTVTDGIITSYTP
jgi:hypothetical protein